jgi:hypothetical protein
MMPALDPPEPQHMTQMYRQSLVAYGQPLCETVADCPSPRGGEVLVRIERCGVCHSDLHLQDGYFSLGIKTNGCLTIEDLYFARFYPTRHTGDLVLFASDSCRARQCLSPSFLGTPMKAPANNKRGDHGPAGMPLGPVPT